jgi:hypothetical protein
MGIATILHCLRISISLPISWLAKIMCRLRITAPSDGSLVESTFLRIEGTYRLRGSFDFRLFYQDGRRLFPQSAIEFDPKRKTWSGTAYIGDDPKRSHVIVVASYSGDLKALFDYYSQVHEETGKWIPINLWTVPSGFREHDRITVNIAKG